MMGHISRGRANDTVELGTRSSARVFKLAVEQSRDMLRPGGEGGVRSSTHTADTDKIFTAMWQSPRNQVTIGCSTRFGRLLVNAPPRMGNVLGA